MPPCGSKSEILQGGGQTVLVVAQQMGELLDGLRAFFGVRSARAVLGAARAMQDSKPAAPKLPALGSQLVGGLAGEFLPEIILIPRFAAIAAMHVHNGILLLNQFA